jgi:phosphopantetheinyl transferase (holo-ACP synthase)
MPLIIKKETKNYNLYVWDIKESYDDLLEMVKLNSAEIEAVNTYKSHQRKLQFLATRVILQKKYPNNVQIRYDKNGKPNLNNKKKISISHSYHYAGILLSDYDVGLDIELIKDKIIKIIPKFLSPKEQKFIQKNDLKTLYLCWGAKESVVKMKNNKNFIYNRDILINPFTKEEEGTFMADLKMENKLERIQFNYLIDKDLSIVWTINQ